MKPIDYIIIGIVIIVSAMIIIRKVTGRSRSCECAVTDCAKCKRSIKKDTDKNEI